MRLYFGPILTSNCTLAYFPKNEVYGTTYTYVKSELDYLNYLRRYDTLKFLFSYYRPCEPEITCISLNIARRAKRISNSAPRGVNTSCTVTWCHISHGGVKLHQTGSTIIFEDFLMRIAYVSLSATSDKK